MSHMITYVKTAFYISEIIRPMNMKCFVHTDFLGEEKILSAARLNTLTVFFRYGQLKFRDFGGRG